MRGVVVCIVWGGIVVRVMCEYHQSLIVVFTQSFIVIMMYHRVGRL